MKRNQLIILSAFVLSLSIGLRQSASAAEILLPRISFEKTVCDLGDVGQGTKNTCEFKFINTGRGLLKIGKISRTCGCTVFHLDKKEYTPNKTGTIKVIYTAGKSTGHIQKSIYVPTNDKANPKIKLTITGRLTGGTPFEAKDSIRVINKASRKSPN
ncbi:MAG: DUF1573 domain-containing protein [Sedimentisphaerales bacterium]